MSLRSPPLSAVHERADASFTDFGGWEMPVEFESIRVEHEAVRSDAGKFDVSHMGQITVDGPDAATLTQRLTTNDVTELDPGEAQYAAITDEDGIMLDDTVVYRLPADAADEFLFVPNAGHDGEMTERWLSERDDRDLDATVTNRTEEYAMLAVQGPEAPDLLAAETDADLPSLPRFEVTDGAVAGIDSLVARTGYTGERGFEILCSWDDAETVWSALDCQPCGLGARDTLRLEMGFLLSGQEFHPVDEPRTPYEAGIGRTVKLDTEFVGRDALEGIAAEGPEEKLVGIELIDRGVPRHGYDVTTPDGEAIGHVTSGTMSPTLGKPIALAYVPTEYAEPDESVRVVVRGEPKKARTRSTPFLDR
ncbi:glycine cleavage system aminomethyltransferase GcvT [Haloarcula sp. S1AR25-5A]|uniref:Probable aminomethyltransferase n=1 Tax=Haloarcula terrestris TaxID=2950533 RepID=A0AAE4EVV9_9EURY|nr:glycine cleavage system aminomethyltransferase GcvT [Haloarcula terrestris]MDS0221003.1 glycine cleavage system aminomethyltransferase GcvT [Haloarcula terrestris]